MKNNLTDNMVTWAELENQSQIFQDRNCYFLGLLRLISSDGKIHPEEKNKLMEIAGIMDFESNYCEEVIHSVFENRSLQKIPIRFVSISAAKAFIEDAIRLALCNGELSSCEKEWLDSVAAINEISTTYIKLFNKRDSLKNDSTEWAVTRWWTGSR